MYKWLKVKKVVFLVYVMFGNGKMAKPKGEALGMSKEEDME